MDMIDMTIEIIIDMVIQEDIIMKLNKIPTIHIWMNHYALFRNLLEIATWILVFKLEWDEVLRSKEAYIKTLREIGVYDEKSQKEIEAFFEAFKSAFIRFLHKGNYGIWWSNKWSGGESRKYMARYYERIFVI